MDASFMKPRNCPHCGMIHRTTCPRIAAIEYHPDGSVKRVEFATPQLAVAGWGYDAGVKADTPTI